MDSEEVAAVDSEEIALTDAANSCYFRRKQSKRLRIPAATISALFLESTILGFVTSLYDFFVVFLI